MVLLTTLAQVLAVIFLLLLLFRLYNSICISPSSAGSQSSGSFAVFWSLHSWRSWCSRRQWVRRYHNGQCTLQTILEVFLNIYVRVACFSDNFFSGKKQNFRSWTIFLTCWIFRISELSNVKMWNWINRNFAVCVQCAKVLFWIDIKVLILMLPCFQYVIILFFLLILK